MLLWPSYQAEVISATPPKGGAASPLWLKALLSPRPKWQTFYLYIWTRVCGGERWESYPKLNTGVLQERWNYLHYCSRISRKSTKSSLFFNLGAVRGRCKMWYGKVSGNISQTVYKTGEKFGTKASSCHIPALRRSKKTFPMFPIIEDTVSCRL